ncbi:hypothetical protein DFH09DRAFT_1356347 [Mycena vulgaris]|nr:hypothetical protein DFH09DRAFT_1356347 [Mycena vulgaris]
MHVPQSATPTASPLSYVSAKLSQRGQSPPEWTHQHPSSPPAAPWIQCIPLPHMGIPLSPRLAEPGEVNNPAGASSMYYPPPGPFAPYMPPVPLPRLNEPSYSSSSSSHHMSPSSRSSRSPHTSSHSTYPSPLLHPLLSSQISFPISVYPFSPARIRVPQDLKQHQFGADAFRPPQNYIQIRFSSDPAINPLVVQNLGSLSVAMILQSLHEHLHFLMPREQFTQLQVVNQATAKASYDHRMANSRGPSHQAEGIKMIDVLGWGANYMIFVGLRKGDGDEWVPLIIQGSSR